MPQATHPRLRASLIGAALMTSAVAIAIYVVPAAEAPYERPEGGGCHLPNPGYNIYEQCGGYSVPFLTHEHREATGPVTRFELFPGGEWRFTKIGAGDVLNGCTGSTSLRELKELATAATWKREPLSTTCDVIPSGTEAWLVDGLEKLAYNACDREQPDPQTEKVIERMLAIEGSDSPSAIQHGDCPRGALACYGVGTVAVRGRSLTYGPCSGLWPDRSTQTTIDQLFAIYRSALGSNPHI